ncbi:hypothetical protein N1851_021705 [Merluccius polli]|uniref:Uncharacterized protein n=1 Tax=Merluccius polli TaxID=89951 RepID=A0AA47MJ44_MERPO|nr:hypothetical protein N1851_021705 [Merluccius polli]
MRNIDGAMRQSAAQAWCLLRLLPLMVGDLVPDDCEEWQLLLLLLSCMELIFSPSLTTPVTTYLGKIIEEHHTMLLELFPNISLRPKHHFMLHYTTAIQKLGPLVQYWAMRFEAKHGFFKRISHVTCNFRNICKTLAFRHQMLQCYNVLSGTILKANFEDIHQVLLETIEGRPILGALDSGSIISLAQRRCMVRILVSHMVNRFGETPTADTKMALSSTLIETFPSLRDMSESGCVIWYSKGRHHRPATGFLEERLRNIRKRMRRLSDAGPRRVEQPPPQRTIPDSSMPLEQVVEMAEWLKHNDQPLIQVEEFMRDTALYRARWVRENSGKSVHDVLQEFPQLTTPGMIAQDFQTIHPDSAMRLYQTWTPELEEKVLNMAAIERKLQVSTDGLGQGNA